MLTTAFAIAVCGGLLAVERRGFLQLMLSRPLVAGTLVGALGGEVESGALVGVVLELLYLTRASLGAVQVDHETLAAVVGAGFAAGFAKLGGPELGICIGPLMGILGRHVEKWLDARAGERVEAFLVLPEKTPGNLTRAHLLPLLETFFAFALLSSVGILLGFALRPLADFEKFRDYLDPFFLAVIYGTAAVALREIGTRYRYLLAALGYIVAGFLGLGGY